MQHNGLYGAVNKTFNKNQDTSSSNLCMPLTPTLPIEKASPPTVRFATNTTSEATISDSTSIVDTSPTLPPLDNT
jgi:hypothetical protein